MSLWVLEYRTRERKNGKWSEWYSTEREDHPVVAYREYPDDRVMQAPRYERRAIEYAERGNAVSEWVSTKDRFPLIGQPVDLWIKGRPSDIHFYDPSSSRMVTAGRTTCWQWDGSDWKAYGGLSPRLSHEVEVTHWMIAPSGPKESQ